MIKNPTPTTDEFGDVHVFSEERLANLKEKANTEFALMCKAIKMSESALEGIVEWLKHAETNQKRFHATSKAYVETLKAIEDENNSTKF